MSDDSKTTDTPLERPIKSWAPQFLVSGEWAGNAQRFATREEADSSARQRFARWTAPTDWRSVPTADPVNYRHTDDGSDVPVQSHEEATRTQT